MTVVANRLAAWLQGHTLVASADELVPYQSAVDELSATFAEGDVLPLVAAAHGVPEASADARETIAKVAANQSLAVESGDQLADVLAGAALVDILERRGARQAIVAALATTSCTFVSAVPVVAELPALAAYALERLGDLVRQQSLDFASLRSIVDAPLGTLPSESAAPVTSSELRASLRALRQSLRGAADEADKALGALRANTHRVSEEIDLLWWTLRPFSRFLSPWTGSAATVCSVAGIEMASRIVVDPPPRGLDLLSDEVLGKAGIDPSLRLTAEALGSGIPDGLPVPTPPEDVAWATPALNALGGASPTSADATAASWVRQIVIDASLLRAARR